MTRIAYVCADPGIPVFGCKGASIHVQEVIRALRRAGASVSLHAARLGGDAPADLADLPVTVLPMAIDAGAERRARAALRANRRLHAALVADGPFDLVYERYSLWSGGAIAYARGVGGCTSLVEVNAPLIDEQAAWRELPLPRHARRLARHVFRHADGLLAVSPGVADWLRGFDGVSGPIEVVPNGVDPARFRPREPAGETTVPGPAPSAAPSPAPSAVAVAAAAAAAVRRPLTIGFVGTLKPWHGLPTLIDAWARLRARGIDARLLLVGDGPERKGLIADLQRRGLMAHAELTGAVAPDRVPSLLARMDIAVAPYPPREDFYFSPLKLYEYQAAGLPVVCSRVGHLDRVIRDGHDGLLFPAGDAIALAATLARLATAPTLRARLGRNGRARVIAGHTWDSVAHRILALATEVGGTAAGQRTTEPVR